MVGIGNPPRSTTVKMGYLNKEDLDDLRRHGAAGDINSRFIDAEGRELSIPLTERTIGIEFDSSAPHSHRNRCGFGNRQGPSDIGLLEGAIYECARDRRGNRETSLDPSSAVFQPDRLTGGERMEFQELQTELYCIKCEENEMHVLTYLNQRLYKARSKVAVTSCSFRPIPAKCSTMNFSNGL